MKHSTIHLPLKVECSSPSPVVYLLVMDTLMILQILTAWWRANSEHPFLQTILNLTLEHRIVNHLTLGCWCLYYLILRWVISKSLNQITSQMVIIFPCITWHCTTNECSEYLYSAFKDPSQYYDLWVPCIAWFCLDACLLSSGYDHRWYGAIQQAIYVVSVEEMAYIGSTWVETAM